MSDIAKGAALVFILAAMLLLAGLEAAMTPAGYQGSPLADVQPGINAQQ